MAKNDQNVPLEEGDDLSELDGIFSRDKKEPDPKKKKGDGKKKPAAKKPSKKTEKPVDPPKSGDDEGGDGKPVNETPAGSDEGQGGNNGATGAGKSETFFEDEGDNEVARAKRSAKIDKIIKATKCKKAITDLLGAININEFESKYRDIKVGKNYGELLDRFQMLLRFQFGFTSREVTRRELVEVLMMEMVKDLETNGGNAKIIRILLEKKLMAEK